MIACFIRVPAADSLSRAAPATKVHWQNLARSCIQENGVCLSGLREFWQIWMRWNQRTFRSIVRKYIKRAVWGACGGRAGVAAHQAV